MQPRVVRIGDAPRLNVLGVDHLVLVSGTDSAASITLVEVHLPPAAGIPRHIHTREDEVFHVLAGEVEFELGDQRLAAPAGTTLWGPRNSPHSFRAPADRPARLLVTITPAGLENMFVELSKLTASPPDLGQVGQITSRYGISFA